jgi:epsilon-lactone hydrolase
MLLRRHSVAALFEAMSHANYSADDTAPETHQAFGDIAKFFDRHLAK